MINDVVDLKYKNTKLVLDLIRFSDCMTKKDIADHSGLSVTTVSTICNELKAAGVVCEERTANSRVGRIPNRITFQYDHYAVIGIDLQIDNVMGLAILNLRKEVVYRNSFDISALNTVESVALLARKQIDAYVSSCNEFNMRFIGVGISVPAIFDATDERLISSSIQMYNGADMKHLFQDVFDLPVYVDNSSNFKAISAHASSKLDNIVCLDVSQGTGVGIICNGRLLRGKNGYAAEIAHIPIGDTALRCASCGSYGCVEAELHLPHLMQSYPYYNDAIPVHEQWPGFVKYIREHADEYQAFLKHIGNLIGHLTIILVNLFDPSLYMVTGYIADIYDLFYPHFYECVKTRCSLSLMRGLEFQVEEYHSEGIYEGICDSIYDEWLPLEREDG